MGTTYNTIVSELLSLLEILGLRTVLVGACSFAVGVGLQ